MKFSHRAFLSVLALSVSASLITTAITAQADDKKSEATGTWTWTSPGRNGGPERKNTLKLKVEGDKLTGTTSSVAGDTQAPETEIKEAKISGDEISFTVTREFNSNKITQKYTGKVSGDTIKGKIDVDFNGQSTQRDWEAKRKE